MNSYEAGLALLEQAKRRLETSRRETLEGSPAYAVRSAQECVELSLKAALRLLGVEYPKKHDVSRVLLLFKDRFPEWFNVDLFAIKSKELAEKREPAMYGDEQRGPDELFTREDVERALSDAEEIYRACKRLFDSYGRGGSRR